MNKDTKQLAVHVSGHVDITQNEFDNAYPQFIRHAISGNQLIVVGDANGTDKFTQEYLYNY